MHRIAQTLYSHKTLHTSPLRASYGVSFVSILAKNNRDMKGFYCTNKSSVITHPCPFFDDGLAEVSAWINDYIPECTVKSLI